ncbi:hypothetical protein HZH66_004135 [Vespula vulgaris]|uniref:Uncharacterized protein n=1 Tax=Vespula vulgaris TaxID=7454 RepID=A0A834NEK1_VESVU|nr:hypothetical protein HZH66_004135 [Vespula vulgaris]
MILINDIIILEEHIRYINELEYYEKSLTNDAVAAAAAVFSAAAAAVAVAVAAYTLCGIKEVINFMTEIARKNNDYVLTFV